MPHCPCRLNFQGLASVVVFDFSRDRLAVERFERGLGIKQIHVTGPALHEKGNHRLRARLAGRVLGLQIEFVGDQVRLDRLGKQPLLVQQPGQCDPADAETIGTQELAATSRV